MIKEILQKVIEFSRMVWKNVIGGFIVISILLTCAYGQNDVAITSINSPSSGNAPYELEDLNVTLKNQGSSAISAGTTIPIGYTTALMTQPNGHNYQLSADLSAGSSVTIDLGKIGLACSGEHEVKVWSDWGSDTNPANDTISNTFVNLIELFNEGFESGSFGSEWSNIASGGFTSPSFVVTNNQSLDGSYSAGNPAGGGFFTRDLQADYAPTSLAGGEKVTRIEFYWNESSNQNGHYVGFIDGNGDPVLLFGSENPQIEATDDAGKNELYESNNNNDWYNVWVHVSLTFNWDDGTYDYYVENTDNGETTSGTRTLIRNTNIEEIWFRGEQNIGSLGTDYGNGDDVVFDGISVISNPGPAQRTSKPQNLGFNVPDTAYVQSPYQFTSTYTESQENAWFVNGTEIASETDTVQHTFTTGGEDTVMLLTAGCFGVDTSKKAVVVDTPIRSPKSIFEADRHYIDTGEVINFTDLSAIGPMAWQWDIQPQFIDGDTTYQFVNSNANSRHPGVEFLKPGKYSVTLKVDNAFSSDTATRTNYIHVNAGTTMCDESSTSRPEGFLYDAGGKEGAYQNSDVSTNTCQFLIEPHCGGAVTLDIRDLDINGTTCVSGGPIDNLKIYDGTTTNGKALHTEMGFASGFYNGNAPAEAFQVTASSGAMLVVFERNTCGNGDGFEARWSTEPDIDDEILDSIDGNQIIGPDTIYKGGAYTFESEFQRSGVNYQWILPDLSKVFTEEPSVSGQNESGAGLQQVKVVTGFCGYKDTVSKQVYVKEVTQKPVADFTVSQDTFKVGDTVQLRDLSKQGPNQWDWDIEPSSGVAFVKGTSPTSPNPYITMNRAGNYRVDLVVSNGIGQDLDARLDYLNVTGRCQPTVSNQNNDFAINEFVLSKAGKGELFQNTTGYSEDGYGNFKTDSTLELEVGRRYVVELGRNTAFNAISHAVWLDMNGNGNFESNEQLLHNATDTGHVYRDTFTVPATSKGGITTLRIASNRGGESMRGCGPHSYGEFEDYQVQIAEDQTPPVITLKDGDTTYINACDSVHIGSLASAYDAVDGDVTDAINVLSKEKLYAAGTHQVIYQVSDESGNSSSKQQTVVVSPDTVMPVVDFNGRDTVDHPVFTEYTEAGYQVFDPCGTIDTFFRAGKVNDSIAGQYLVDYHVRDLAGNDTAYTKVVNVVDNEAPQVQLNGEDTVSVSVYGKYNEQGVNATDNYYDSTSLTIDGEVNVEKVDTYHLDYHVTDPYGNTATVSRVVFVEDNEAPEITNVPDDVVKHDVGAQFSIPVEVSDNYYSRNSLKITRSGSFFEQFPEGNADSIGVYNAMYIIEDGSGNESRVSLAVHVVDRKAPSLDLMGEDFVTIPRWEEYEDSLGSTYLASDNYYSDDELTLRRTGSYFTDYVEEGYPKGLYEIKYKVVDPAGNESIVKTRGIVVENTTGIREDQHKIEVQVYPNPSDGRFSLNISLQQTQMLTVDVINAQGQEIKSLIDEQNIKGGEFDINLDELSAGLYQLRIQTEDEVVTKSIVINK